MNEVSFDRTQFDRAMREFTKQTGISTRDVLRDQMRLFMKAVVAQTPPKKAADGKRAINRSLNSIFGRIDDREALEELDFQFGHRFWPLQFDMEPQEMPGYHEKMRSKSTGRTPRRMGKVQIGGKTWGSKPYVLSRDLNRYAREKYKRVGRLKAGWNAAARIFGFIPSQWILKHGTAEGAARDTFNPERLEGYMEAANQVPYAGRQSGIVSAALRGRVRALESRLSKELDRMARSKSAR